MRRPFLTALVVVVLGALVAVGPSTLFAVCDHGMKLASGSEAPMRCHWTAMASVAFGGLMALCGVLLAAFSRAAARMAVAIVLVAVAVAEALIPCALIGVCRGETMPCHMVTAPAIYFLCGLAIAVGLFAAFRAARQAGEERA